MSQPAGSKDPRAIAAARLRRLIPMAVGLVIVLVVALIAFGPRSGRGVDAVVKTSEASAPTETSAQAAPSNVDTASTPSSPTPAPAPPEAKPASDQGPTGEAHSLNGLHVKQVAIDGAAITPLGSLEDPSAAKMQVQLTRQGAGIVEIPFTDIWTTAAARRQAANWYAAKASAQTEGITPPLEDDRYVLARESQVPIGDQLVTIPLLSARSLTVNGTELNLVPASCWQAAGPGAFIAEIRNDQNEAVARVHRKYSLNDWDILLEQHVENLSGTNLSIRWSQYGPPNLEADRSRYMDRRRFRYGWLLGPKLDPDRLAGVVADGSQLLELTDVASESASSVLWPNEDAVAEGFELSWFASTNRYFALAIHPTESPTGHLDLSLQSVVGEITRLSAKIDDEVVILTGLAWPARNAPDLVLAPGEAKSLSMGIYAGPTTERILGEEEPYVALHMDGLILYQMSSFCAICTFQWLAHLLLAVLAFFDHWVVFDWGVAIILLVVCVRALLHPITRRSQMGMQKFGKQMQRLKPEIDKLQKKHGGDRKKMQEEQMRLFREHGINPLQMLGCLPMFLQMPIWIALYAALYFSFDLRQQPAFWGVFQEFGGWPFLADLASPDHFFWEASEPFHFFLWNITGINLLPLLMGLIFFFQQKYMTPATSMSPEQETQQKIMRIMMVVLFPIMLYSAPSGLTLYILTSSSIGILESRHIRKQVDAMDFDMPTRQAQPARAASKAAKDPQSRAYAKMMERRNKKKNRGPEKRFKKRK
ncbi:MAG: membrane protein insertase YidC [Phycisphaerales bacterium]|nr:membrane protein insertase YidC [Phycisphaerales bacterium]